MSRLSVVASALLLGAACTITATNAGPTYWGDTRQHARLENIARAPSDAGTEEALRQWIAHPDWEDASRALFAAIPSHTGPLVAGFDRLTADQQQATLAAAESKKGEEVGRFVLAVIPKLAGAERDAAYAALAGRQDETSVRGLLDLAKAGNEADRIQAIRALEPPDTALARDGLIALFQPTTEPQGVREAALDVLAPYDVAEARLAVWRFVQEQDGPVVAFALDRLDKPRDATETTLALGASQKPGAAAAAVRLLNRAEALPSGTTARFVALTDLTQTLDPTFADARYEAARALVDRGDLRGAPALVRALDLPGSRTGALASLDTSGLASVPAARAEAASLTTPEGKAELARWFTRFGGPEDGERVAALAPAAEKDALVAALKLAPYGLFPDGKVRYTPLVDDLGEPVELGLADAVAANRTLRDAAKDPVSTYIAAARAFLAGGRAPADREALAKAASGARDAFTVYVQNQLKTQGSDYNRTIYAQIAASLRERNGWPVTEAAAPTAGYPGAAVSGDLACAFKPSARNEPVPSTQYWYTVTVTNERKLELERQVNAFPYDKREDESCSMKCYCTPEGSGQTQERNFTCDFSPPPRCNCQNITTRTPNPSYVNLVNEYNNEPVTVDQQTSVPMYHIRYFDILEESCNGPVSIAFGALQHTGQMRYAGSRVESWVIGTADPVHPETGPLPRVTRESERNVKDDRKDNLKAATEAAISGFGARREALPAVYRDGVKGAVAKKDPRGAREALIFSDPALIATDAAGLVPFQAALFSDGERSLPRAWR